VRIRSFRKEMILIVYFVFLCSALTFAAETDVKIQGRVMDLIEMKNMVIVSEMTFVWDKNSIFYDEKGSPVPITAERLKRGAQVSIEATSIKNKPYMIKKIFLLPPK